MSIQNVGYKFSSHAKAKSHKKKSYKIRPACITNCRVTDRYIHANDTQIKKVTTRTASVMPFCHFSDHHTHFCKTRLDMLPMCNSAVLSEYFALQKFVL
jgi:hypothetical protein